MIPEEIPIERGMIVRHDEGGLRYAVEGTGSRTDGYEATRRLGLASVNYVQLDPGKYPVGTHYNKDEEGFRAHFTIQPPGPGELYLFNAHVDTAVSLLELAGSSANNIDLLYAAQAASKIIKPYLVDPTGYQTVYLKGDHAEQIRAEIVAGAHLAKNNPELPDSMRAAATALLNAWGL